MIDAAHTRLSRRALLMAIPASVATPALAAPPVVTMLGDSITAGLGLPRSQALPARLQAALAAARTPALVRGAGVSGDTTGGGLARLDFSVEKDTAVCVVALGGNDILRGGSAASIKRNLQAIITKLQARGVKVVLAGIRVPPAVSRPYARELDQAFAEVGAAPGVIFVPDFLGGVKGVRSLNQADGVHPNARGVEIIVQRLTPAVVKALRG